MRHVALADKDRAAVYCVPVGPQSPGNKPHQSALFAKPASATDATVIEGEVARITYENEESAFRVLKVSLSNKREITLVGTFPRAPVGIHIRATGSWTSDPRRGEQFRADTLLVLEPDTLHGIERYLSSGAVAGIGPVIAKRIVERFGTATLAVLDREPERLLEVEGLGHKRASGIQDSWGAHRAIGSIILFLQTYGASASLAGRIYKRFGPRAVQVVSAAPYRLALDVWGVGFATADRIAHALGISKHAPERAQAGLLHTLHERALAGHVFVEENALVSFTANMLEIDDGEVRSALAVLETEKRAVIDSLDDQRAVYRRDLFDAELLVATRLATLSLETATGKPLQPLVAVAIDAFEAATKVTLGDDQRVAIGLVATAKVVVLTGGPGVGKTTIVRAVLGMFDRGLIKTRLAAPTGRAAKRVSEATGREATTIHRLLEFDPQTRTFKRDADNPIVADAVIIDETSMVDVELMASLLVALAPTTRLVLVGDVDQLPSVGPGAVLRDIIASGAIPTARLQVIFRQAAGSQIVENAHRIQRGESPISDNSSQGEFYIVERTGHNQPAETLVELVTKRIPSRFGLSPMTDIQVLCPIHRGETGTLAMNRSLQAVLNPTGPSVTKGERIYRLRDKVMQLRNDHEREIYNGDIGFVSAIDEASRTLKVRFDEREVDYSDRDLDELALAYATSIHKSQGSEYPAVVIPLQRAHFVMLSRNLLYTAVTRGKRLVVLVADPSAIHLALAEVRKDVRATGLARRIAALA